MHQRWRPPVICVQLRCVGVGWAGAVGVCQQRLDGGQYRAHIVARGPAARGKCTLQHVTAAHVFEVSALSQSGLAGGN